MDCSVAQCLEVMGEWWSMLIVRDCFMGVTKFEEFQRRLGISRNILNERLSSLVESGVLVRVAYSEHPPRYDYKLTAKGRDLWPVLTAMRQWGDQYAAPKGAPIELVARLLRADDARGDGVCVVRREADRVQRARDPWSRSRRASIAAGVAQFAGGTPRGANLPLLGADSFADVFDVEMDLIEQVGRALYRRGELGVLLDEAFDVIGVVGRVHGDLRGDRVGALWPR